MLAHRNNKQPPIEKIDFPIGNRDAPDLNLTNVEFNSPHSKTTKAQQFKNGISTAYRFIYPLWLTVYLGGEALESMRTILAPQSPPIRRSIPSNHQTLLHKESTAMVGEFLHGRNYVEKISTSDLDGGHHKVLIHYKPKDPLTNTQLWDSLKDLRILLKEFRSDLSDWFESVHKEGRLSFRTGSDRECEFRKWSGELIIDAEFLELSNAEQIVRLAHEKKHADESLVGYLSNSVRPQVLAGALLQPIAASLSSFTAFVAEKVPHSVLSAEETVKIKREFDQIKLDQPPLDPLLGYSDDELSKLGQSLPQKPPSFNDRMIGYFSSLSDLARDTSVQGGQFNEWRYECNPSERSALMEEIETSRALGVGIDNLILSSTKEQMPPMWPGQELMAIGLGVPLLLKKRKRSANK